MNALRLLAIPRVWISVVGLAAALALIYIAYLAAVVSPQDNLENLPVALVNEDQGGELAGREVNLGDQIVERVTGPDSPAKGMVAWARPASRDAALAGIANNEYYGAIVIPADYSERISALAGPPTIPIAIVNEDEGAIVNGRRMKLGAEVERRVSGPESPAPAFVEWSQPVDRSAALDGLEEGRFYASIVIPNDYSQKLASISGPPTGMPPGAPAGQPAEPAELKLLTSAAVRHSTTGLIENAFSGIVSGVSGATSERILGGLSEAGAPVPPGAGALISDPVRGRVSETGVSGEAGSLPKAPRPAGIEVLTNASAGQAAGGAAENISTGIVDAVSRATSERISSAAGEQGAQFPPEVAAVVGDPVRAEVTQAQPVGPDSGNGQSPFFLAFLANLSAFVGAAAVFFGVGRAAGRLEARGIRTSRTGLWTVRLLVGLLFSALVAAVELWVAFGVLGVEHEADIAQVYLFLVPAVAAILYAVMFLVALLGPAGIGIAAVLGVLLGLVSSGGSAPLEALPGFYRTYADWLPIRYVIDGLRSLLFYDGSLDAARLEGGWRDGFWFLGGGGRSEAAGLEDAVWMIGAYLTGAVMLGYVLSLIQDLATRQKRTREERLPESVATGSAR